jgi:CelD/BcsL family acetyltransferase involved in cellulose biosynthesis
MTVHAPTDLAPHALDTAAAIASARRAALADRYAADSFIVEWLDLTQLDAIADDWRDLAARTLVPNAFYEPAFALAAAPAFGHGAGALLVWSGSLPRKLLGLFPARIVKRRYGLKLPMLIGWTHPYAPLGTPLVDREAAEPVIAAWLAHLADNPAFPGLVLLRFAPQADPFAAALSAILRRAQMPSAEFHNRTRALLAPGAERSAYLEHALGGRKYRELRRTVRRLGETGTLSYTTATEPDAVAAALDDFLTLEASGWKGQAGTAAACDEAILGFVKSAVAGLAGEHKVAIDRLVLDGQPAAVGITLRSGDAAWFWKIAYSESLARYSPGVMLISLVTERLAADTTIGSSDSCATADHAVINRTWSERLTLCDRIIAVRPRAHFARAMRLERLRSKAIAAAKRLRSILRHSSTHR